MCVDGKDNSEIYFREMHWGGGVEWFHLVQNRRDKCLAVVSTVMNVWVFILLSEQLKFIDFVQVCYMFRLSVSAIIRWECWSTKRANRGEASLYKQWV